MLAAVAHDRHGSDLFLVGTRGALRAGERGVRLAWHAAMVPQATLVPVLAERIAQALYAWLGETSARRVELVVPRWSATSGIAAERRAMLPFDFARFAGSGQLQPPLLTLPPRQLLAGLAEEYVFAELCAAALAAFAAENDARVAAMMAARSNLEQMGSDLQALVRGLRHDEITAEVVELASGVAARDAPAGSTAAGARAGGGATQRCRPAMTSSR